MMGLGNPCRRNDDGAHYTGLKAGRASLLVGWWLYISWEHRSLSTLQESHISGRSVILPLQKRQQQRVHFFRLLALYPVAAALDYMLLDLGHDLGHAFDGDGFQFGDRVAVADDEQGRLLHLLAGQLGGALPVALVVAIPVQRTMETIVDIGFHIDIEGLWRTPGRRYFWVGVIIQPARIGRFVRDQAVAGGGTTMHQGAQGAGNIGFQFGLGRAGLL